MDISNYTSHFHDGELMEIHHHGDELVLTMKSAETDPKYVSDLSVLSNSGRFCGRLHIQEVQSIEDIDGTNYELKKYLDLGTILDLEVHGSVVELVVLWNASRTSTSDDIFVSYRIEGKNIYWENLPDLVDPDCKVDPNRRTGFKDFLS